MKKMTVIRLEGNYVICEDEEKKLFAIEKGEAPVNIAVGMIVLISDDGTLSTEAGKSGKTKHVW